MATDNAADTGQPAPHPAADPAADSAAPLSARAAADRLGLNERTIRRAIARGLLPANRGEDGTFAITPGALAAYAVRRGNQPAPHPAAPERPHPAADNAADTLEGAAAPPHPSAALLAERVAQLEHRLAASEADRDRWHAEAQQASARAAAALAAREDAERELRLLLARATAPALPSGQVAPEAPTAAPAAPGATESGEAGGRGSRPWWRRWFGG
jgi:hypothetical protein